MRITIEEATGKDAESAMRRIRHQVFEQEMGLKLPRFSPVDNDRMLHLLARTELGDPVAALSIVNTSGDQSLLDKYGLEFGPGARAARYTQLAVLKAYRGMSIPLMMIIEGHRRFVVPRQIQYTWLLFDAGRAAASSICKLLAFAPSERVLESEYGATRALVRHEIAPESIIANRAAERFLDQFVTSSMGCHYETSHPGHPARFLVSTE